MIQQTLKEHRDKLEQQVADTFIGNQGYTLLDSETVLDVFDFIDDLIERIDHPDNVPVLTLSIEKVQSFLDGQDIPGIMVDQALVEDIAQSLGSGGFLDDALDNALDEELNNRFGGDQS